VWVFQPYIGKQGVEDENEKEEFVKKNRHRNDLVIKGIIGALIAVSLFVHLLPGQITEAGLKKVNSAATVTTTALSRNRSTDYQNNRNTEDAENTITVLWEDPVDLESRNLFYGIGGEKGAPFPTGKYLFIRREPGGTSEKIQVEDERDRRWTVKLGLEPRPETAATRIVWAVGYHVDQDYFLKQVAIKRGKEELLLGNVRFERDDDGFKKVGRWDWQSNPFAGTRELDGLKTLMALLNNFDLKTNNNKIIQPKKKKASEKTKLIYYVNDLGATFGSTGYWFTQLPIIGEMPAGTKGIPEQFVRHQFIESVRNGKVIFHMQRRRAKRALEGVKIENACWIGELLARLSDKQLSDAFRAGGFNESETAIYIRALRQRIKQLRNLKEGPNP
jgi:hypothetical protein